MEPRFTVSLAQIKPRLADVPANLELYERAVREARGQGADLVVFPELSLTGYHLKDEVQAVGEKLDGPVLGRLRELSRDLALVVGFVEEASDYRFFNSAALLDRGEMVHVHRKVYLPTYGMFDENRYFARGGRIAAFDSRFGRAATLVCEDLWHPSTAHVAALDGAITLLCPSSSPARGVRESTEQDDNARTWELLNRAYAVAYGIFVIYVNRVGFEDGVGFWGGSEVLDASGRRVVKAPYYEEAVVSCEIDLAAARRQRIMSPLLRDEDVDLTIRELQRIQGKPQ
ncbi:MAG: carbon-nitrogen hydrolase [Deltaproteobacteria bacterium]|nr:carbon-nitrogen hydrolase [Deltaproteobacteria bacterium]